MTDEELQEFIDDSFRDECGMILKKEMVKQWPTLLDLGLITKEQVLRFYAQVVYNPKYDRRIK